MAVANPSQPASIARHRVRAARELGALVRARRKESGLDQATAAGLAGVGTRFFSELERGKANLRLSLVLQVLDRLGLEVWVAPRGERQREPGHGG